MVKQEREIVRDRTLPYGETRTKIKNLIAGREGEYVSVSELARQVNLAKQTVSIHLQKLSKDGVQLPLTREQYLRQQKERKLTAKKAEEEAKDNLRAEIIRLRREQRLGNAEISSLTGIPVTRVEHIVDSQRRNDASLRLRSKRGTRKKIL